MKKVASFFLAATLCLGTAVISHAQNSDAHDFYKQSYSSRNSGSFDKNTSLVTIGYGFPNYSVSGSAFDNGFGPLYIKYEHGILNEVGIGAYAAFAGSRWKTAYYKNTATSFGLGVMGFYHFNKLIPVKQLDVYAGAGIGFDLVHYNYDDKSPYPFNNSGSETNFDPDGIFKVGARWYFTPGFSVFAEGGYDGMSDVNLGVSFRF